MVTVAGLFHVLTVLAEILGHVEWVVCIIHSVFVREPQPVALLAASRLELGFEFPILLEFFPLLRRRGTYRCCRRYRALLLVFAFATAFATAPIVVRAGPLE